MKEIWTYIQMAFAAIGGWLGWFLGGFDGFLYALVTFVVIDYVTGLMCAILEKKLSSVIGARGIFKKVVIFTLVGVAHIIDSRIIGDGSAIRTAVIFFYLSNEGISIIENASKIGLPIPQKLKDILAQLNSKKEDDEDETDN
jgi:toxin secretion/phage lysis holin